MLKDQNILCISSIDWDFIWQGHQQIMSTLAANGNRVLFIENTGVRRPNLRDMPRLRSRIRNWWNSTRGFREESENLFIYSPLVLPFPYSRVARAVNRRIIVGAVRKWMAAVDVQKLLAWTFLPTSLALDVIRGVDPEIVVYYCIDDFLASSAGARSIRRSEDRLLRTADLVFVTSMKLRERAAQFRDQVDLFPFAVDFARFDAVRRSDSPVPGDLSKLPRPIVGYVGGLHRFIDQEMVADAARRRPDVNFAFIGPPQCDVSTLTSEPNIHLLGKKPHSELPGYIKGFDVGIVPYRFDPYTANVYPTKLNEYLAMGIPVVATGLPEIERFNREHGEVVTIANESEAMAEAIDEALEDGNTNLVSKRVEVARSNGWDARIEAMSELIEDRLKVRRARRAGWEDRLHRVYRMARTRVVGSVALVAAIYLLVFHTSLLWMVAAPLRIAEAPRPADAVVVFAAGVGESGLAGGGYQERVRHAVELYRAGMAPRLVFSSGYVFNFQEADVMRNLAVDLGVPADSILLERESGNTYEQVRFVGAIVDDLDAESVLMVSSPYHMRRATLTWEEQVPGIEPIPSPVPASQFYSRGDAIRMEQIRGIAWEYAAIVVYWLRGWI